MINSSCDQPIGYPIYVSPLTTSYAETNEQLCSVVGSYISVSACKAVIIQAWRRSGMFLILYICPSKLVLICGFHVIVSDFVDGVERVVPVVGQCLKTILGLDKKELIPLVLHSIDLLLHQVCCILSYQELTSISEQGKYFIIGIFISSQCTASSQYQ